MSCKICHLSYILSLYFPLKCATGYARSLDRRNRPSVNPSFKIREVQSSRAYKTGSSNRKRVYHKRHFVGVHLIARSVVYIVTLRECTLGM